jgi:hypothetical protein
MYEGGNNNNGKNNVASVMAPSTIFLLFHVTAKQVEASKSASWENGVFSVTNIEN